MRYLWQLTKAKKIGLQKTELPYVHLHMPLQTDEDVEAAINAPPESDSSEISPSRLTSLSAEPEVQSSPKRKRESLGSPRVDLTGPSGFKKPRCTQDDIPFQPSNIPITQFTSSDRPNRSSKGGASKLYSRQGSRYDRSNDSEEPYPFSSQPRVKNSYSGRQANENIHKDAPTKKRQTRAKRESKGAPKLVKVGISGFKNIDRAAMYSLVKTTEHEHSAKAFNAKGLSSPSPRSKRAALRHDEASKGDHKPARREVFKKPRRPPTPEFKRSSSPPSSVPQPLQFKVEDQRPSGSASTQQDTPSIEATNLEIIAAKLNIPIDIPTSSAALSPGPSFDSDVEDGNSSSSLSSAPKIEELDSDQFHRKWLENHASTSPKEICPICKDPVSKLFKDGFLGPAVSSVRQQQNFCTAHRVRSAEETWRAKGYPTIDWKQFPRTLPKYDAALSGVLDGTHSSFYRNALEDEVKCGANRTLRQAWMGKKDSEGLKRGYYGTKGARIMMDYIMSKFASRIRRLGGTDKLISAAGVSGFVQAVLVPELVVMLVKDDMHVDEEQARVILEDSAEVGYLLNEEEDEAIRDAEEEEALEDALDRETVEILELD
ncbi:MAG: hypothetical protein Q9207_001581 [Kuettlingeria erythrocarpa]